MIIFIIIEIGRKTLATGLFQLGIRVTYIHRTAVNNFTGFLFLFRVSQVPSDATGGSLARWRRISRREPETTLLYVMVPRYIVLFIIIIMFGRRRFGGISLAVAHTKIPADRDRPEGDQLFENARGLL